MNRPQTTKELAGRIDPGYVRRPSRLRRWRGVLSFVLVVAAVAGWFVAAAHTRQALVNPGHVSAAHAMWESNCALCHDGDGHGGFRKTVSDAACLQCHSAPAHHPNQILRVGADAHSALALAFSEETGHMRSANCTACHVEHRGHTAISGIDDANCTKCHADIKSATSPHAARAVSMMDVTAFDTLGHHPFFGRKLLKPDAAIVKPPATFDASLLQDPTHLKFNHKVHMSGAADPAHGAGANCAICHVNHNRAPAGIDADKSVEPSAMGDGKYMRPISYVRDCESCHALTLPSGATLPHVAMDLVLSRTAHPEEFYRDWLARLPQARRAEVLGEKDAETWVKDSVATLRSNAGDWVGGFEKAKKNMEGSPQLEDAIAGQFSLEAGSAIEPAEAGKDIRVISAYVAYAKTLSARCALCHEVKELGLPIAAQSQPTSAPADAAAPATQPVGPVLTPMLATVPTGIPESPRRWFTDSTFDHKAHGNITCTSCHSRAPTSTLTSDVLSPNLIWTDAGGATVSCTDCHHPKNSMGRGAGAKCITCHTFHDKTIATTPVDRRDVREFLK